MTNAVSGSGGGPNLDSLLGEKEPVTGATGQGQGVVQDPTHSVTSPTSIEPSVSDNSQVSTKSPISGTAAVDAVSAALADTDTTPAGTLGAPPKLPNAPGTPNHGNAGSQLGWLDSSDGSLMWAALSEMARTSMRDMKSAKESMRAFQDAAVDSKKNNVKATEQRHKYEREEAVRNCRDSCITAVIVCAISIAANSGGDSGDKTGSGGNKTGSGGNKTGGSSFDSSSTLAACANVAGSVYTSYAQMKSKTDGEQRAADEKELEAMRWELNAEMLDQMVEESKSSYEESKELFSLALRILTEHYELAAQATQTYTRG